MGHPMHELLVAQTIHDSATRLEFPKLAGGLRKAVPGPAQVSFPDVIWPRGQDFGCRELNLHDCCGETLGGWPGVCLFQVLGFPLEEVGIDLNGREE